MPAIKPPYEVDPKLWLRGWVEYRATGHLTQWDMKRLGQMDNDYARRHFIRAVFTADGAVVAWHEYLRRSALKRDGRR